MTEKTEPKSESNPGPVRQPMAHQKATCEYYASLAGEALKEELQLEATFGRIGLSVDFDSDD